MDYQKLYTSLISSRKINPIKKRDSIYTELHHIIPKCLGGTDSKGNLIRLTAREHFIAHRLLSKIYPKVTGLALAVLFMSSKRGMRINSREYARLSRLKSEYASKVMRKRHEDPLFKELMKKQNEDPVHRAKMLSGIKKKWEDPEFRSLMKMKKKPKPKDTEQIEKIKKVISDNTKKQWEDPEYRKKMSNMMDKQNEDPEYRVKIEKGRSEWVEKVRLMPWLMPCGTRTKEIWSLAQVFYDKRQESVALENDYSAWKFCKIYNEGKNLSIFNRMRDKFVYDGWIPNLDPNWLKEFEHINW